jgi:predicted CXXCH cytochrome family protein
MVLGLAVVLSCSTAGTGIAAGVEILTPRPGSTIMARNPMAHLVLRLAPGIAPRQVRVLTEEDVVLYDVNEEADGVHYLHFRLPLVPGTNRFTIFPEEEILEVVYRPITAAVPAADLKDADFFHQNDRLPESCGQCHELLEVKVLQPLGQESQESCGNCHRDLLEAKYIHGPVANKICLSCHQLSQDPWRIGFPTGKIEKVCFACHTGKADWFSREFIHGPLFAGGCTLCHSPHGGEERNFLWAEGSLDLCIACHSDKENLITKDNPLPYVHGLIPGSGCVICHDPHATDNIAVLRMPINPLCVSCHTRFAGIERGHPVAGHPVEAPRELRRAKRKLSCAGCHDPHGSFYPYMLFEEPLDGVICRKCHGR